MVRFSRKRWDNIIRRLAVMCYFCDMIAGAELKVKRINSKARIPTKRKEDSGYDVYGIIEEECILMAPGENVIIGTGLTMEFPEGLGFIVANRGSVGTKCAIVGAHVVDSGYRGEVKIDLHNISNRFIMITDMKLEEIEKAAKTTQLQADIFRKFFTQAPIIIPKSAALTQGMIVPTLHLPVREVDELSESVRKDGAFGSTNKIKV